MSLEDLTTFARCIEYLREGKEPRFAKDTLIRLVKGSQRYLGRHAAGCLCEAIERQPIKPRRENLCEILDELLEEDPQAVDFLQYSGEAERFRNRLESEEILERDKAKCYSRLLYTMSRKKRFSYDVIAHRIGVNGCILIVGAGFSYTSHVHITAELKPIMRQVFTIAQKKNPELSMPTEPNPQNQSHWRIVKQATSSFQGIFKSENEAKHPSSQHIYAWRMFSENRIRHIVSFNWDDLIEKASGFKIEKINAEGNDSDHALWKLHGDVNGLDKPWVLPFDEGRVFPEVIDKLKEAAKTEIPIISIGYTWRDKKVSDELSFLKDKIIPINHSWFRHLDFIIDDTTTSMDELERLSRTSCPSRRD